MDAISPRLPQSPYVFNSTVKFETGTAKWRSGAARAGTNWVWDVRGGHDTGCTRFDLICNAQLRVRVGPAVHAPASSRHVECTRSLISIIPKPPGSARHAVPETAAASPDRLPKRSHLWNPIEIPHTLCVHPTRPARIQPNRHPTQPASKLSNHPNQPSILTPAALPLLLSTPSDVPEPPEPLLISAGPGFLKPSFRKLFPAS